MTRRGTTDKTALDRDPCGLLDCAICQAYHIHEINECPREIARRAGVAALRLALAAHREAVAGGAK